MTNLAEYLDRAEVDADLKSVILSVAVGAIRISVAVSEGNTGKAGTTNVFGEEQMALDVLSDKLMTEELAANPLVGLVASEEQDDEQRLSDGEFALCYDPLDGSSLLDVNLAVGSIVGIYKTDTFIGVKGDEQLASLIVTYGPRTTILLTVRKGVVEFALNEESEFVLTREGLKVEEGKMFAPGNLRACKSRQDYLDLVNFWCKEQYTLRYSGGMVPDVGQIILKGKGIFSYPGFEDAPNGKLRLLVESAPMALLMEEAGGAASDGRQRILEKEVKSLEDRTPIFIGSKGEVERCNEYLG